MKHYFKKKKRILLSLILSLTLIINFTPCVSTAFTGNYTRNTRITQPTYTHYFSANELGVVNFNPTFGNKTKNVEKMINYIDEAHEKGVKILVFPEQCVSGYVLDDDPESDEYKWAIDSAEYPDGKTARTISKIADSYEMWIIYGGISKVQEEYPYANTSVFVCSPEGDVTVYNSLLPQNPGWTISGGAPVMIDAGEYGKLGICLSDDAFNSPELMRYYAANGCNILINVGGSCISSDKRLTDNDYINTLSEWEEYYKLQLESIASREGFTILSANLCCTLNSDKNTIFPGGSVIMNADTSGARYYGGTHGYAGTSTTNADIITETEGLVTNQSYVSTSTGSTCRDVEFAPESYVTMYQLIKNARSDFDGSYNYNPKTTDGPKTAVVNMTGYWGNKKKTKEKMISYIEEAAKKDVDILVFPETVLTGYGYLEPSKDPFYHKYGVCMQVATAETIPGKTTYELSEYAKKYDMYIIFGMTEKDKDGPIRESMYNTTLSNPEKVYNSAAILCPDGTIDSYQKMHRTGTMEKQWSVPGNTPKIIDTKWGKMGVEVCRDGHFFPEIARYYALMGCVMLIHPTATTGNSWYRKTRMASYTERDSMAVISANSLGGDGIYTAPGDTSYNVSDDASNFDSEGNFIGGSTIPSDIKNKNEIQNDPYWNSSNWTYGVFNSTSLIITKGSPDKRINYNKTGHESDGFSTRGNTSPLGLEIAKLDLSNTGFKTAGWSTFRADLYEKMYDQLAKLYRGGYSAIYNDEYVFAQPFTCSKESILNKDLEEAENPTESYKPDWSSPPDSSDSPSASPSISPGESNEPIVSIPPSIEPSTPSASPDASITPSSPDTTPSPSAADTNSGKKKISKLKLTKYKSGSKIIKGVTIKKATVKVKIGKISYTVISNKKGKFTIKTKKKLEKKQKIKVTIKKKGYKNKKKTFKVKK